MTAVVYNVNGITTRNFEQAKALEKDTGKKMKVEYEQIPEQNGTRTYFNRHKIKGWQKVNPMI